MGKMKELMLREEEAETNAEGLTFDEWWRAATHFNKDAVSREDAIRAWRDREDPTEYGNVRTPVCPDVLALAVQKLALNMTPSETRGVQAIIELQKMGGITESPEKALRGWRGMSDHEKQFTLHFFNLGKPEAEQVSEDL